VIEWLLILSALAASVWSLVDLGWGPVLAWIGCVGGGAYIAFGIWSLYTE